MWSYSIVVVYLRRWLIIQQVVVKWVYVASSTSLCIPRVMEHLLINHLRSIVLHLLNTVLQVSEVLCLSPNDFIALYKLLVCLRRAIVFVLLSLDSAEAWFHPTWTVLGYDEHLTGGLVLVISKLTWQSLRLAQHLRSSCNFERFRFYLPTLSNLLGKSLDLGSFL